MELKYGKNVINFDIPSENVLGILEVNTTSPKPLDILLKNSTMNPIGKSRLSNVLRNNKPRDIVVLVSDITRSIAHYAEILRFLVSEIIDAGIDEKNIEFIIALGTHRRHTYEENNMLYKNLTHHFRFSQHDCRNNLSFLGKTSTGLEVQVNKRVREAEFVIATGKIDFHYLAGYSGGRKSILPGISSYETIRDNHCKLKRSGIGVGEINHNIIAQEMDEACRMFDVDYLFNVVETPYQKTAGIFCGHPEHAFTEGVQFFRSMRTTTIREKADCAIVSAGGYPQDRNFFMSHKSLNMAIRAVKPHGSIIIIGQCSEGFGNEKFLNYMLTYNLDDLLNYPEKDIHVGGHRAFVTAKMLRSHKVYVLADLESQILTRMKFLPVRNVDEVMTIIKKAYGEKFKTYIIPDGTTVLPIVNSTFKRRLK
jgi:nickel-dependent lactate racemase